MGSRSRLSLLSKGPTSGHSRVLTAVVDESRGTRDSLLALLFMSLVFVSRFVLVFSSPSYYFFVGMCNSSVYIDSPGIKLDTLINYLIAARASCTITIPITQLIWTIM